MQPLVALELGNHFGICSSFRGTNGNKPLWLKDNDKAKTLQSYKSFYLCSTTIGTSLSQVLMQERHTEMVGAPF